MDPPPESFGDVPDGAYVCWPHGKWSQKNYIMTSIDIEDVPKNIRLHARLINGKE